MYCVPKIKRFNTITQQSQKSWRSDLSSDSKRHIFLQDISQNLLLLKEDLVNYFENNKDYLFPTDNEEYICIDTSSSMVSPEELLYRLIDIIKNNDFVLKLEEASSTIMSLSKQLDDVKEELKNFIKKGNNDGSLSSYRSDYQGTISTELINKLKEKNRLSQKIIKDYDNLVDEYILGLNLKSSYEVKIKNLENNLKNFEKTKIQNEELIINNKQMKDELFLNENEIKELKKMNNKLYEENIKSKDEIQRLNKIIEFKNKEYQELEIKNKDLLKDNYTSKLILQRNEEKMKLVLDNFNEAKEKNKIVIQDLEKKISDKNKELEKLQRELKNNIKNLIEDNKKGNIEFVLDEFNDKLKIIYKGELICAIEKFKREIPKNRLNRTKYKINSNIHPTLSEIKRTNIKSDNNMALSTRNKVCEINNFNITYKLSKNEYEFDYSNSSKNYISNDSNEKSKSICLDKLCQEISNSQVTNQQSSQKSKSIKKNNLKNYVDNFFKNYYEMNKNRIRRSMTDFKGGKRKLNQNNSKILSFGVDVESIKEEKEEENISISSFDFKINSKKGINSQKQQKSKELSAMSNFLETDSIVPVQKKNDDNFIINCVDDFTIRRKYFYPNNVKLNIKKINVKRIIQLKKKDEKNIKISDDSDKCQIF